MATTPPPPCHPALRISQLDAAELDSELVELLKAQLRKVVEFVRPDLMVKTGPELTAGLRLLLWYFSLRAGDATVGQQLLGLCYRDVGGRFPTWMSYRQKVTFAAMTTMAPWLEERSADLSLLTPPRLEWVWGGLEVGEKVWKVASLVNFLVFLHAGQYQLLLERLLPIRALFPRRMPARDVSFHFMDREMLWHGFAEFLFFVLPLINWRRLRNMMVGYVLSRSGGRSGREARSREYGECAVCGETPVNVHEIPDCPHVFCYVCLAGNLTADPGFCCPLCGQRVDDPSTIRPVIVAFSPD